MSKYVGNHGRPDDWGGSPLEELGIWAAFQPGAHHKPNIKALKQAVNDLCHLTMQKTAGQKKYAKAGDLSFDDLDGIKWTILIEAVILVLSGKLDGMEDESDGILCITPCKIEGKSIGCQNGKAAATAAANTCSRR